MTTTDERIEATITVLAERHPESKDLLGDLDNLYGDKVTEMEAAALRNQGEVILAAIRGDLTAWPGCMPQWENRP